MGGDPAEAASNTEWLTIGSPIATSADNAAYQPPTTDDWLAAMGLSSPQYVGVTEALAHTDYDLTLGPLSIQAKGDSLPGQGPNGVQAVSVAMMSSATALMSASASSSSHVSSSMPTMASSSAPIMPSGSSAPSASEPATVLSGGATSLTLGATDAAEGQAPFQAASYPPAGIEFSDDPMINTATIPSSRMDLGQMRRRAPEDDFFSPRAFVLASDSLKHRFGARQLRQRSDRLHVRAPPDQSNGPATPQQNAITRGYSDGWRAAKTFASAGGSRLGE